MSSCTSCGHESASTARFCPECGLPLISPSAVGAEIVTGADKSHWLTTSDVDGGVLHKPVLKRGAKHPVAISVTALILTVLVWNLFRAPTTEIDGLTRDLAAISSTPRTAALLGSEDEAPADDDAASSTTTTEAAESEAEIDYATRFDDGRVDVGDLDPALTRYELFAQQSDRLLRIDLADGSVAEHEVTGRLLGAFVDRLYFLESNGGIVARPLDNLDAPDDSISEPFIVEGSDLSDGEIIAAVLTSGGIVHLTVAVFSGGFPELTMIRRDLLTRSEKRADVAQFGAFGLVEVPGAGLFELTAGGFRPLVDGSAPYQGERLIVVEQCDTPDRCRRFWFDRVTKQEVDKPVPENSSGWVIGASGRVAVTFGAGGRVFTDTESGNTLTELTGFETEDNLSISDDLTPDDRFLATADAAGRGDAQISDLERDVSWALDLPRAFNLSKILFVPKQVPE